MRIQKRFADFWFETSKKATTYIMQAVSCGFTNVMYSSVEIPLKDLFRLYIRMTEEGGSADIVVKRYVVYYEDRLELMQASNSEDCELIIYYSLVENIEVYKGIFIVK